MNNKNPPCRTLLTHIIIDAPLIKRKVSNPPILLLSNTHFQIIPPSIPSASSSSGFLSKLHIPFFYTTCMLHATHLVAMIRLITSGEEGIKSTTGSSTSLYSSLPLTSNILITTCYHKPSISDLLFTLNIKFHSHTK
jgi:hypothetical protein